MIQPAPIIICGTGGSGTRVVARIARIAGNYLGSHVNVAEDARHFVSFYDHWIDAYLAEFPWPQQLLAGLPLSTPPILPGMAEEFSIALERHRSTIPAPTSPWAWKNPRSIFLLPFFHQQFPDMKLIHLVRDGRDMAYSTNQNQVTKHGKLFLTAAELAKPLPLQSMLLWSRLNFAAARYGETQLKSGHYLRVRFEDLCQDPKSESAAVLLFSSPDGHITPEQYTQAAAQIAPPESLGRHRTHPLEEITALTTPAADSLKHFHYTP
jgi:hypothetical protein